MALAECTLALAPDVQGPEAAIRLRGVQPSDAVGAAWRVYGERLGENAVAPCAQIAHLLQTDWGCVTVEDMGALLLGEFQEVLSDPGVQRPKWLSATERNFRVHFRKSRDEPPSALALTHSSCSSSSAGSVASEKERTQVNTEGKMGRPTGSKVRYDPNLGKRLKEEGKLDQYQLDRAELRALGVRTR
jgi:hypothetical protein